MFSVPNNKTDFIRITLEGNNNVVIYTESYLIRTQTYKKIKSLISKKPIEMDLSNVHMSNIILRLIVEKSDYEDVRQFANAWGDWNIVNSQNILFNILYNAFEQNNLNLNREIYMVLSMLSTKFIVSV